MTRTLLLAAALLAASPALARSDGYRYLPQVDLPRVQMPRVQLPQVQMPRVTLPPVQMPRVTLPPVQMPRIGF